MTVTDSTANRTDAIIAPVLPATAVATSASLSHASFRPTGFWGRWQTVNGEAMIEHERSWMERMGWVDNLRSAAQGTLPGTRRGREFTDSDVYKLVEAMSWELGRNPGNAQLRNQRDDLVEVIAAAQEPDGYINTMFGRPGQRPRYSDLEWGHELYNYGHLLQASIASTRVEGPGPLLSIAQRVADHIVDVFGVDGDQRYCGHPNVEAALTEFGRLTGNRKYIEQATLFVDRRGAGLLNGGEFGREYFQDLVPVRETRSLHGHAVRALYLAAGAVDVAVENSDGQLLHSLEEQWERTVLRRTHLTGGMGSRHTGEAFGDDWELSPDRAYCETCAGVGSIMFSWRLYLATGNMRYNDLIERTLFNVVATSPAADGRSFFYSNPLHQRTEGEIPPQDEPSERAATSERAPWFEVSCCPPNVSRTLATLATYAITGNDEGVQVLQYGAGTWTIPTRTGQVTIDVETDYPKSGAVRVTVVEAPAEGTIVTVRVPAWSKTTAVRADERVGVERGADSISFSGVRSGDELTVSFDMSARFVYPASQVDALRGCVAVERGPQVFALEGVDLPDGTDIADIAIDLDAGIVSISPDHLELRGRILLKDTKDGWPYASEPHEEGALPIRLPLHPYEAWGQRGRTTMRVWLPTKN